jgi:hypothetical protein
MKIRLTAGLLTLIAACSNGSGPQVDLTPTTDHPAVTPDGPPSSDALQDGPHADRGKAADKGKTSDLPYLQHYLSFNESLCADIASGVKKSTLRNNHVTYIVAGEWIKLICSTSKTSFKALVTMVRLTTWGGITPSEYQADGFKSQAEMMQTMQTFYPGITLSGNASVVTWDKTSPYP